MNVTLADFWIKIGIAILCGAIVGFERQIKSKPAGIRTSILICLGTTLFISLGIAGAGENTDSTRVLGQVVTGIGFIGPGVMLAREGIVIGVTSAAVIWILAATGAMIGFGKYLEALTIAVLTLGILIGIGLLEGKYPMLRRGLYAPGKKKNDKDETGE